MILQKRSIKVILDLIVALSGDYFNFNQLYIHFFLNFDPNKGLLESFLFALFRFAVKISHKNYNRFLLYGSSALEPFFTTQM